MQQLGQCRTDCRYFALTTLQVPLTSGLGSRIVLRSRYGRPVEQSSQVCATSLSDWPVVLNGTARLSWFKGAFDTIRVGGGLVVEDRDLGNWFLTKGARLVHSASDLSLSTIPPYLSIQGARLALPQIHMIG